jgi:predicted DNA-binding protein (MmcQ/YjbR family)
VTRDELIACALAFAGAVEDYPFGEDLLTVKVGGKVFAWIPLDDAGWLGQGPRIAVKLPADLVTELHHAYPGQVGPPGRSTSGTGSPSRSLGTSQTARSANC